MKILGNVLAALYAALMLSAVYLEKAHSRKGESLESERSGKGESLESERSMEAGRSLEGTKIAPSVFIAAGCLLNLGYVVCSLFWDRSFLVLLILGMIGISAGALMNGFRQKKVHIPHHIIRLILEVIITAVCWIGG